MPWNEIVIRDWPVKVGNLHLIVDIHLDPHNIHVMRDEIEEWRSHPYLDWVSISSVTVSDKPLQGRAMQRVERELNASWSFKDHLLTEYIKWGNEISI